MPANFEDLLDRCLSDRVFGRPLDACLRQAEPSDRGELESLLVMVDDLRDASRPGLSASARASHERLLLTRAALLRQARRPARAHPAGRSSPLAGFARLLSGWRPGFAPVAALLLLVVSFVLVASAGSMVSHARPDDAAYNLKLSWEQTQLLLATNDAQRARISLDIAQNRLAEVESLAVQGQPIPGDLLEQVQLYVNQAILFSGNVGAREAIPILRNVSELLAYERVLLVRFMASLPEPERATVELAINSVQDAREAAIQALEERVEERVSALPAVVSTSGEAAGESENEGAPAESPASLILPPAVTVPREPELRVAIDEPKSAAEPPGAHAGGQGQGPVNEAAAEGDPPGRRLGADNRPAETGLDRATAVQQSGDSQHDAPDGPGRGKPEKLLLPEPAEAAGTAINKDDPPGRGHGGPVERGSQAPGSVPEERGQPATTRGNSGQAGEVRGPGAGRSGGANPAGAQPKQQPGR